MLGKATAEKRAEAKAAFEKANPGKVASDKDINSLLFQQAYDDATKNSDFGTGGKYQRAMQAATAAIQGLAGGDLKAALAGGAAPYIAGIIARTIPEEDKAARVLAHAAAGAAIAAAQGKNAAAGAAGASTGEIAGMIALEAYGKPVSELSETEKQTISAFATLAAGLAGGLTGDSTADALAGGQAGKNAVENNFLSVNQLDTLANRARNCSGDSCKQVIQDMVNTNVQQQEEIKAVCSTSQELCQQKYGYLIEQWDVFKTTVEHMAGDDTLPSEFRGYLSAVYHLGMEAEGTVAQYGWTERFKAMGFDEVTAGAMAATLPALTSGTKGGKASGPKVPPKLEPFKNPAQGPIIPSGWVSRPGRTEGSTIYFPAGTDPSKPGSTYIRVMPPGSTPVPGLENGYWISVKNGQPINPATGGTGTRGETHVPLPPDTMPPKR